MSAKRNRSDSCAWFRLLSPAPTTSGVRWSGPVRAVLMLRKRSRKLPDTMAKQRVEIDFLYLT